MNKELLTDDDDNDKDDGCLLFPIAHQPIILCHRVKNCQKETVNLCFTLHFCLSQSCSKLSQVGLHLPLTAGGGALVVRKVYTSEYGPSPASLRA